MTTITDTQQRKTGDTLRLSGQFTGTAMPTNPADWVGASAKLNIVHADTRAPWRVDEPVTLDVDAAPFRYQYEGAPPDDADVGTYEYEVEVTFADTTITTFPNGASHKYKLKLVKQLG